MMQPTQYKRGRSRYSPKIRKSMPNRYHYDPDYYQRELEVIWYKMWLNVCRSDELGSPRDYKVVNVGEQNVVITRDLKGNLRAFHNTCRHRGSILCTETQGRFEGGSIVCPYHAWTYSLEGDLIATPHQLDRIVVAAVRRIVEVFGKLDLDDRRSDIRKAVAVVWRGNYDRVAGPGRGPGCFQPGGHRGRGGFLLLHRQIRRFHVAAVGCLRVLSRQPLCGGDRVPDRELRGRRVSERT